MILHPRMPEYLLSSERSDIDIKFVHGYLSKESYWATHIPFALVEQAIMNSVCFGLFFKGAQIGFARIITDKSTFAYLADVFVLQEHRGRGLATWMLEHIHAHEVLQGLRRWMLLTRDAQSLYQKCGWEVLPEEQRTRCMQREFKNPYQG